MSKGYYELKAEKQRVSDEIMLARKRENQNLRDEHPRWFRALEVLLLVAFISNLGAYFTTKALLVASEPEPVKFVESNPITAKTQDFPTSKESNFQYLRFLAHFFVLSLVVGFMFWQRSFTVSYWGLWWYTAVVVAFSAILILDFVNNVSILVGVVLR